MESLQRLSKIASGCILLFSIVTYGTLIPTGNKIDWSMHPKSFFKVGTADGKGFFVDNEAHMSWTDAKAYCESANMQLASITSLAQAALLNNSFNADNFFWDYWTAGRDIIDLRQFIWDNDNIQPDNFYLKFAKVHDPLTCLTYFSYEADSLVRNFDCNTGIRPLCEIRDLEKN